MIFSELRFWDPQIGLSRPLHGRSCCDVGGRPHAGLARQGRVSATSTTGVVDRPVDVVEMDVVSLP